MIQFNEEKQKKKLDELRKQEEEEVARILSSKYGISYVDLTTVSIDTAALSLIPETVARKALVAAFYMVGKKVFVATHSPKNKDSIFAIADLERQGYFVVLHMSSTISLEHAWERYKDISLAHGGKSGVLEISNSEITSFFEKIKTVNDLRVSVEELLQNTEKTHQISKVLEILLAGGMATVASDIHIESEENSARLRLRLDGVLQDIAIFTPKISKLIISRIKLTSGMKLNITTSSQDGRFSVHLGETEVEIRASAIPGTYGESIVLRILNPDIINIPFSGLGIDDVLRDIILKELAKPNGLILTTGPTGSGKTTTLYAFMREIYTPEIKIITIENPIEYHLPGIVQTQTDEKKGYTFFEGLKSSLRQDPDVIMVGEIRDKETAQTSLDAALTGHLVFSTLHTNNAAGAIPRLIGLGVNPKIIGGALNIILAQRLVRILCKECKKEADQTDDEKKLVDEVIGGIFGRTIQNTGKTWRSVGCVHCNNTGFKGQIGLYEGIKLDNAIDSLLETNPSDREIKKAAKEQGILDMREDGVIKTLGGITTLEELRRVVDLSGVR
jgi:type IV pilus assembly protein PilB